MQSTASQSRHLLSIEPLTRTDIWALLDLADHYADALRRGRRNWNALNGRTQINLFFEASTRTQSSFELAGKRLGANVMNMSVRTSAMEKGESLVDTAVTLNAMLPDLLIVRHHASGAPALLAQQVNCAVINAGDGAHEHPTQALLDALTIRRRFGQLEGLTVAICGDILHSRVARSNVLLLSRMGVRLRLVAPPTLLPAMIDEWGVEVLHDLERGVAGTDVVIMLRLQSERAAEGYVPSRREYFRFHGLDPAKLAAAPSHTLVMHPGPMNRGFEIDSLVADDPDRSVIREQVEMGVAVRMAVMDILARRMPALPTAPDEAPRSDQVTRI